MEAQTAQEIDRELEGRVAEAFSGLVALFRKLDAQPRSHATCSAVRKAVRKAAVKPPEGPDPGQLAEDLATLTRTEAEVLRKIGMGMTNREIAAAMFISPLTVRTHVKRVHDKLDVKGRARLAVTAARILASQA